jgi:hypothetical protein
VASTGRPGRNLRVAGFGVGSVWMNIGRSFGGAEAAQASYLAFPRGSSTGALANSE